MERLNCMFEEDIEMQDSLDDLQTLADDSEDIIIGAMEDRGDPHDNGVHLFTNNPIEQVNDDGLTEEEEHEINMMILNSDDDFFDDEDDD